MQKHRASKEKLANKIAPCRENNDLIVIKKLRHRKFILNKSYVLSPITHQTEQSGLSRVYEDDISKPRNIKTTINNTNKNTIEVINCLTLPFISPSLSGLQPNKRSSD